MKEQIKAPEKIKLSDEEITNLSDAQFKTLVIKMLTKLVEYGPKVEEKVKAMKSEVNENVQRTNSDRKETRTHINDLEKEEITIQPEQNEETRIQKNEESLIRLWDLSKHANIQIIGMPEGEEEEQEIENLLEKIMKEYFPNLVKEIDIQFQEAQKVQKSWTKETHSKIHYN